MFDMEGEDSFVEACAEALKDRTVILVTHRTASLALADRVLCLEDGKIIEKVRGPIISKRKGSRADQVT